MDDSQVVKAIQDAQNSNVEVLTGTVSSNYAEEAVVVLDNDPTAGAVVATANIAGPLPAGTRVSVLKFPPRGLMVLGSLGAGAYAPKVGEVIMWYGAKSAVPFGWLVMDGSAFSSVDYPLLAAHLGVTNTPDFDQRFPVGATSGVYALGSAFGQQDQQIFSSNLPPHSHSVNINSGTVSADHSHSMAHTHNIFYEYEVSDGAGAGSFQVTDIEGGTGGGGTNATIVSRGSNSPNTGGISANHFHGVNGNTGDGPGATVPFEIIPPYLALYFIIRAL